MNYNDGYDFKDGFIEIDRDIDTRRVFQLKSPTRIDIMNKEALKRFNEDIEKLENLFNIDVEEPLPNAKLRGVYMVAFLDKEEINGFNLSWIEMY